ncbi:hypothetical protein HanRHA438_Chr00c03g0844161 [Helianthus annuus]|uniref:DUF4283 domain-containing protein n=1 Tax=Helianthus annuus TaxID=4232 RepID=A0A9K3JGE2_HELAN|nr:hypothetical protein HanXRQr2_Chr03g0106261 [Helianthus annuus]KAJ0592733.1 hypothetical protein HanHA300_Chr03g0088611 [Helianthus annuus]KAJ0600377.1 hypothetical protein HanIR_Chr03g0115951 [Helianthus annuus]KAJ0607731.1 hypothetical protein HanHA89_Chr03g0100201 [Helianthus annuus]KAJ0943320.1 hypothetical protein HanPSC8_Chr03g0102821 [Helianthus annuus]
MKGGVSAGGNPGGFGRQWGAGGRVVLQDIQGGVLGLEDGRGVVVVAKSVEFLCQAKKLLRESSKRRMEVRYLGGLKILVSFESSREAVEFLGDDVGSWGQWFQGGELWNEGSFRFDRFAWIRISGVPASLWDNSVFDSIAGSFGEVVANAKVCSEDGDLSFTLVGILVKSGRRINSEVVVVHKNLSFNCWISETHLNWAPRFVSDASVRVNFPEDVKVPELSEDLVSQKCPVGLAERVGESEEGKPDVVESEQLDRGAESEPVSSQPVFSELPNVDMEKIGSHHEVKETCQSEQANFGGDWRSIFADCMKKDGGSTSVSNRYFNEKGAGVPDIGPENKSCFQSKDGGSVGPEANGLIGEKIGDVKLANIKPKSANRRYKETRPSVDDDPFNLTDIIRESGLIYKSHKR